MDAGAPTGDLADWNHVAAGGVVTGFDYPVYQRGTGPAVILMHEYPGITPQVVALGDLLVENDFAVTMPYLFGAADDRSPRPTPIMQVRLCISKEFSALGGRGERGFTTKLKTLAEALQTTASPRGVGVIGMCFTGGFALAAAVSPMVAAPVLSQPSVPIAVPWSRAMPVGRAEMTTITRRARDDGLCVLGLRFSGDRISPKQRFAALQQRLGDAFEVIELDSAWGNPDAFERRAHSVLTKEVRVEPPNDAARARDRVVAFLRERIAGQPA